MDFVTDAAALGENAILTAEMANRSRMRSIVISTTQ